MARIRLPYPFNDPQDDVVFPASGAGTGYRAAAPREERPAPKRELPWWVWAALGTTGMALAAAVDSNANYPWVHWTARGAAFAGLIPCAAMALRAWRRAGAKRAAMWGLVAFALGSALGAVAWFMVMRPRPQCIQRDAPASETATPLEPVAVPPPLRPEHGVHAPVAPGNPRSVFIPGAPTARGMLSLDTRPSSICTIAGAEFRTIILRLSIPVGQWEVECHTADGAMADRFVVTIAARVETRLLDRVLMPVGALSR
ncbi:MAG: hypothetical protein WCJ30_15565 [Deltaproteobacteria bacterium]